MHKSRGIALRLRPSEPAGAVIQEAHPSEQVPLKVVARERYRFDMSQTPLDDLAAGAIAFWNRYLPEGMSSETDQWIRREIRVLMILWRDIGRLNRNRDMWQELTQELEKFDPTCAWTRHYDRIYFEAQLLLITRSVKARRGMNSASLENMLKGFEERPEMLEPLETGMIQLPDVHQQARPRLDIADLDRLMKPIMILRDKFAAHTEMDATVPDFGWNDLEACIELITKVFKHYSQRLTGRNFQVEYDDPALKGWHSIFREPLFSSER